MAVPKKRTGHSAQGKRRANWKATKPETAICSNCGEPTLAHTVCTACGHYKGEPVSLKDKKTVEVKEEKKTAKKSTKKSTKKEEVVEETKVEEVKTEEVEAVTEETTEEEEK